MVEGWPERIEAAQAILVLSMGGATYGRIRFGSEQDDLGADEHPCRDCRVVKGEFHVPSCDGEECPRCHAQLITCDCPEPGDGP